MSFPLDVAVWPNAASAERKQQPAAVERKSVPAFWITDRFICPSLLITLPCESNLPQSTPTDFLNPNPTLRSHQAIGIIRKSQPIGSVLPFIDGTEAGSDRETGSWGISCRHHAFNRHNP
jgi:hypothetical protein